MDYFSKFNLIEGTFWIFLSIAIFLFRKNLPKGYKRISFVAASTLCVFGLSDFAEARWGSFFEPGLEWLFVVKVVCVAILLAVTVWYLILRIRKS